MYKTEAEAGRKSQGSVWNKLIAKVWRKNKLLIWCVHSCSNLSLVLGAHEEPWQLGMGAGKGWSSFCTVSISVLMCVFPVLLTLMLPRTNQSHSQHLLVSGRHLLVLGQLLPLVRDRDCGIPCPDFCSSAGKAMHVRGSSSSAAATAGSLVPPPEEMGNLISKRNQFPCEWHSCELKQILMFWVRWGLSNWILLLFYSFLLFLWGFSVPMSSPCLIFQRNPLYPMERQWCEVETSQDEVQHPVH